MGDSNACAEKNNACTVGVVFLCVFGIVNYVYCMGIVSEEHNQMYYT